MNDREVNHVRRSGGQRVLERGSRERKREREALPWLQLTQQERLPWLQPYQGHASRRRRFIPALLCLIFHLAPLLFLSSFSQVHSFFLFPFCFQALFRWWENVGNARNQHCIVVCLCTRHPFYWTVYWLIVVWLVLESLLLRYL